MLLPLSCVQVGETPLHLSSIKHNMELAKHLIDKGAGVNTRAHGAKSLAMAPLHWFLFMNQCGDGVEALVEHGADVNALCYQEDGNLLAPLGSKLCSMRSNLPCEVHKDLTSPHPQRIQTSRSIHTHQDFDLHCTQPDRDIRPILLQISQKKSTAARGRKRCY